MSWGRRKRRPRSGGSVRAIRRSAETRVRSPIAASRTVASSSFRSDESANASVRSVSLQEAVVECADVRRGSSRTATGRAGSCGRSRRTRGRTRRTRSASRTSCCCARRNRRGTSRRRGPRPRWRRSTRLGMREPFRPGRISRQSARGEESVSTAEERTRPPRRPRPETRSASFRPRLFDSVVGRDTWLAREKSRDGDYSGGPGGVNQRPGYSAPLDLLRVRRGSKPISCRPGGPKRVSPPPSHERGLRPGQRADQARTRSPVLHPARRAGHPGRARCRPPRPPHDRRVRRSTRRPA